MDMTALQIAIATFCGINNPEVSIDYKIECLSYVANCAIIGNGVTNAKIIKQCQDKWIIIALKEKYE